MNPLEVQAKSRQERVGLFPASSVAAHIAKIHQRADERGAVELELVIERDIREERLPESPIRIGDLPAEHPLAQACASVVARLDLKEGAFDRISVKVLSFADARSQIAAEIAVRFDVAPAVASRIATEFVQMIAAAADANAEGSHAERRGIDRTALHHSVHSALVEIDSSALTAAIDSGACEPVDLDRQDFDSAYFLGVHAQPGHIAAGLPAPRPDQVDAVLAAMDSSPAVLISGPSGVGKSTILWMTAYVDRHVTWYRVNRLLPDDVEDIYRLVWGHRPSLSAPVGLLVDGIGIGEVEAWDRLVRRIEPLQHVFLVGTVRVEDLVAATTASLATRVDVALDEDVAERIYTHLRDADQTEAPHWREAYEASNGLTLEYTYELTQGTRLPTVLGAQVSRLVDRGASGELDVLGLVATAHLHDVTLPVSVVKRATGLGDADLRRAIAHLKDEHLLLESGEFLRGLHMHRSRELAKDVHANPPPTLSTTVQRLLTEVEEHDLPRLVVGLIRESDDLDDLIVTATAQRIATGSVELLVSVLHALRAVDFLRHAKQWAAIIENAGVPPALRPISILLGMGSGDLPDSLLRPSVVTAATGIRSQPSEVCILRDALFAALDTELLINAALSQSTAGSLAAFLAAYTGGPADTISALVAADWSNSTAHAVIVNATADEYAAIMHIAAKLSPQLSAKFLDLSGGDAAAIDRIMRTFPTLIEAHRENRDGVDVAVARVLFVDDELSPNPNEMAHSIARALLRSLPACAKADIETVRAGGTAFEIGGLVFGQSGLLVEYAQLDIETEWNKARAALTVHELGTMSRGSRAHAIRNLLEDAKALLTGLVHVLVSSSNPANSSDWIYLGQSALLIADEAEQISRPIDGLALFRETVPGIGPRVNALVAGSTTEDPIPSIVDGQSAELFFRTLAQQVANSLRLGDFRLLATHASTALANLDTLIDAERWDLLGLEGPPPTAAEIRSDLVDLVEIADARASGVISWSDIRGERSGSRLGMVARVAALSRRRLDRAAEELAKQLEALLTSEGLVAKVLHRRALIDDSQRLQTDIGVVIECGDVLAWAQAAPSALKVLMDFRETHPSLPPTMICPSIGGRVQPALARQVIASVFPSVEACLDWFPEARADVEACGLPTDIEVFVGLLARWSSLNYLATQRPLDAHLARELGELPGRSIGLIQQIAARADDPCISAVVFELKQLHEIASGEASGSHAAGYLARVVFDDLAEQAAPGVPASGTESEISLTIGAIKAAAIQWHIDPARAIELFSSTS